tara:strand:+ start:207 stop:719 length:513 start_codon:yes stop_codon:yes gene_type:complete
MSNSFKLYSALALLLFILTGCATIVGGGRYNAHIAVKNHPNASILYGGSYIGNGHTTIKVPRRDANNFSFKIKEEGCSEQKFNFERRTFRGWALAVSIPSWTLTISGAPISIPLGLMIDLAGSVFWKPDIHEKFVSKTNHNNYNYIVDYTGCKANNNNKIDIIDGPYLAH